MINKEKHLVSQELWDEMLKVGWVKETILGRAIASEILEELPYKINEHYLTIGKDVEYYCNVHYGSKILVTGIGLPNALAKMWLYLHKESIQ